MLIVGVLFGTVGMGYAIVAVGVYALLPRGVSCPACRREMLPIHTPLLDRFFSILQQCWCLGCGWHGLVRRSPPTRGRSLPRRSSPYPVTRV